MKLEQKLAATVLSVGKLLHFCVHVRKASTEMEGQRMAFTAHPGHFCAGWQPLRMAGPPTVGIVSDRIKHCTHSPLYYPGNDPLAFLRDPHQHSFRTVYVFQKLPEEDGEKDGWKEYRI